ncbi:MAG: GNAT family N-acetyltransferase [Chitinophagales bacterium]
MNLCCSNPVALTVATEYTYEFYSSISDIREAEWLKLIPGTDVVLQPGYLKLLEETQQGNMDFIYALIRKEGGLIGACYFQVVHFSGSNLVPYFPNTNRFGEALLWAPKRLVNSISVKLLVSGNLFVTGEKGIYFLSHFSETERSAFVAACVQKIFAMRRDISAALLPHLYSPESAFDQPFLESCYRRIAVESDMTMDLPKGWESFHDYLKSVSSKYRVRANKILKNSQAITSKLLTAEEIAAHEDDIFRLYQEVAGKAYFNIAKFPKSYFLQQKCLTPDTYQVIGYFIEERLVGFMSLFVLEHHTEVHYCGIDYSVNKELSVYQRMLYEVVRYAIEHKIRRLHFGRTAPEVKSTIGAVPAPMYGYLKHRNPVLNWVMQLFTSQLKPRQYQLRNPFKD